MKRYNWNDDKSSRGLEGWYGIKGKILYVYVRGTNSLEDWLINFMAWPGRLNAEWVHYGYKNYALWLAEYVNGLLTSDSEIEEVRLIGISMGGGVISLAPPFINKPCMVFSIAGPNTSKHNTVGFRYRTEQDLVPKVPPWFLGPEQDIIIPGEFKNGIDAHLHYDVEAIIDCIMKDDLFIEEYIDGIRKKTGRALHAQRRYD